MLPAYYIRALRLPGIVAHRSALRGGERMTIPDFGDAPARLEARETQTARG